MTKEKQLQIIQETLGEVSVIFISQGIKGTEMIMPTEKLLKIAKETVERLNKS